MENDNSKDIANSLNKYTDYAHKGTNLLLDSAENINKWYQEQLNKITEGDVETSRIETGVDNTIDTEDNISNNEKEISTKVKKYSKIQTNNNKKLDIPKTNKIQTASENNNAELTDNDKNETIIKNNKGKLKVSKGISTAIKGAKLVNNSAQRVIRTGKDISTGLNENGITTFKSETSRIMTKPIRKVGRKITKKTLKYTKKLGKKIGKKVITKTTNVIVKIMKLITKLVVSALKLIISMLPQMEI